MPDSRRQGAYSLWLQRNFTRLADVYGALLNICLKAPWLVVTVSLGIFALSMNLLPKLRKEFIPPQDQGNFLIRFEAPVGASLEFTSQASLKLENTLREFPEIQRLFLAVGGFGGGEVNTGIAFVSLKPRNERSRSQAEIMSAMREELNRQKDLKIFIQDLSTRGFTAQRGFPVEINIRGGDWKVLEQKSAEIAAGLEKSGLAIDVNTDYRLGQPELRILPLREEAAKRGISIETITATVNAAIGGMRQGKFTQDGRRYDVRLRLEQPDRIKAEDILDLQLRNMHGELIPISDVIKIEEVGTLQTITRRNRERSISIYANVAPGKSQADALAKAEELAKQVLPEGYRVFWGGGAQTFKESFESLHFVLWLGVAVAYMVLASQFNSFIHPLAVLLSMPFSVSGAFLALWIGDQSINLYSMIGIILLMGIVKKNAILLVEFVNHKRFKEGRPLKEAILEGAPIRLRPILMTTCSTLAAAVPPALALGPGAESRIPMAVAVLGGVAVSTLFTLIVVPCAYKLLAKLEGRRYSYSSKTILLSTP